MSTTLAVEKRRGRWAIVAKPSVIQRTASGVRVRTGALWGKPKPDRVVGRYTTEADACYTMGRLDERLSRADR